MKRRIVQIFSALLHNGYLAGFVSSRIYTGSLKGICAPGLNCASCPAATFACPFGMLQNTIASWRVLKLKDFLAIAGYVLGFLFFYGLLFGRFVCGWLCPFGLLQELLYKVPFYKKRLVLPKNLQRIPKYVFLFLFGILLPALVISVTFYGEPWFCKYICPAGTLEAGIGNLLINPALRSFIGWIFIFKLFLLFLIIIACLVEKRFFCKNLCPLGLFYGFFNRFSLIQIQFEEKNCINCGACQKICTMNIDPKTERNSVECIRCLECVEVCPSKALSLRLVYNETIDKAQQTGA